MTMYTFTIQLLWISCILTLAIGSSVKVADSDKEDFSDVEDPYAEDSEDGASFGDSAPAFAAEEMVLDESGKLKRRPLRPTLSSSEKVVPIQLMDFGQSGRAPRRKNLHRSTLLDIIGDDFDPEWMAMDKPNVLKVLEDVNHQDESLVGKRLAHQVQKLNVSAVIGEWLVTKARCPVMFVWEDVGPHFWPRWMKRGECVNGGEGNDGKEKISCSWPDGMHCVPAESVMVQVLRWHCRQKTRIVPTSPAPVVLSQISSPKQQQKQFGHLQGPQNHRKKQYRCQWLKVPYPITARCFCSC